MVMLQLGPVHKMEITNWLHKNSTKALTLRCLLLSTKKKKLPFIKHHFRNEENIRTQVKGQLMINIGEETI